MNRVGKVLLVSSILVFAGCSKSTPTSTPTSAPKALGYLDQAEQLYVAKKFSEASASALLAVEDRKAQNDKPGTLKARAILACCEARLGSPPVKELRAVQLDKGLDDRNRQRVNDELARAKATALTLLKSARAKFANKHVQLAIEEAEKALRLLDAMGDTSQHGSTQYLLWRCYKAAGDNQKAEDYLEQAAEARPPSREARQLLGRKQAQAQARADAQRNAPASSRLRRDRSGNVLLGSDSGLDMAVSPEGYVAISIDGQSDNEVIFLVGKDWSFFKKCYQEMLNDLAEYQRTNSGGGTSRVVASSQDTDLVMCAGTLLRARGWETRSSRPVLEIWLCKRNSSYTPWRSRPTPGGMRAMIRQADQVLAERPKVP